MSSNWYAVYIRSRHEQKVNDRLREKNIETFLPLIERWSRRRDRRKRIHLPLFPGYIFAHTLMDNHTRLEILKTESVVRILRNEGRPATIPDEQINAIKAVMKSGISPTPHPYLKEGMRVRVVDGPLIGIEGILVKTKPNKHRLVISVDLLQESICVEMDDLSVESVNLR